MVAPPVPPAAVMLGEWSYRAPRRLEAASTLNAGLQVRIAIDSLDGMRFWGHVTLWFAGDVGIAPSTFGRVAGRLGDSARATVAAPAPWRKCRRVGWKDSGVAMYGLPSSVCRRRCA